MGLLRILKAINVQHIVLWGLYLLLLALIGDRLVFDPGGKIVATSGLIRATRLQEALSKVWQQEAAPRAAIENGTEEGPSDSSYHRQHYVGDGRAVVPRNVSVNQDTQPLTQGVVPTLRSDNNNVPPPQFNSTFGLQNVEDSTAAESSRMSGTWSSGVVPAWTPSNITFVDQFVSAEAAVV